MSLHLSRETKLFVVLDSIKYEIPILDGYAFSQAVNSNEVVLSEASTSAGVSRRGRTMFNTSLAPVEFSFQTYMQPFKAASSGNTTRATGGKAGTVDSAMYATDNVLWALFAGKCTGAAANGSAYTDGSNNIVTNDTTNSDVTFAHSNNSTVGTATFVFSVSDGTATGGIDYEITGGVLNEASIDFDLEGLATISWSGMGSTLKEGSTDTRTVRADDATDQVYEGVDQTNNFVQNKLMTVAVVANDEQSGISGINYQDTFVGTGGDGSGNGIYNLIATGGSITFSNNITFLTPEELGKVNVPIGHVTGTRSITGNVTCYLNEAAGGSADLFQDLIEATTLDQNSFSTTFTLGGASAPNVTIALPQCNFAVPTHSIEDIISVDLTFDALPTDLTAAGANGTNEATLTYVGVTA